MLEDIKLPPSRGCEPISFTCLKEIGERKGHPGVTLCGCPVLLVSSEAVHKGHPAPMDRTDIPVGPLWALPLPTAMLGVTRGLVGGSFRNPRNQKELFYPPPTQPSTETDTGSGPQGRHREVAPTARDKDIPSLEPLER